MPYGLLIGIIAKIKIFAAKQLSKQTHSLRTSTKFKILGYPEILRTSVKGITNAWKRKQAKKVLKKANRPIWRYKVAKGMDNVRGGPRFNLTNRPDTRLMKKHSEKKV